MKSVFILATIAAFCLYNKQLFSMENKYRMFSGHPCKKTQQSNDTMNGFNKNLTDQRKQQANWQKKQSSRASREQTDMNNAAFTAYLLKLHILQHPNK